jgi:hypothetical protein
MRRVILIDQGVRDRLHWLPEGTDRALMKRSFVYRIDGMLMPDLPAADANDDESDKSAGQRGDELKSNLTAFLSERSHISPDT